MAFNDNKYEIQNVGAVVNFKELQLKAYT